MTDARLKRKVLRLSVEERLELAAALWESVEKAEEQPPLPAWQVATLDERIAADEAAPDQGSPWPEVKRRILNRL